MSLFYHAPRGVHPGTPPNKTGSGPGYIPIERAWAENDGNPADWCWVEKGSEKRMLDAIGKALK